MTQSRALLPIAVCLAGLAFADQALSYPNGQSYCYGQTPPACVGTDCCQPLECTNPNGGGNTCAGEPIDMAGGSSIEPFEDFAEPQSVGELRLVRYYSSTDYADGPDQFVYKHIPLFGQNQDDGYGSANWWLNFTSYVDDTYWVHEPGGRLVGYDACTPPCWAEQWSASAALRDRLYVYDGGYTQYLYDGRRLSFTNWYSDSSLGGGDDNKIALLTAVEDSSGNTIESLSYGLPFARQADGGTSLCGRAASAPYSQGYLESVADARGNKLVMNYKFVADQQSAQGSACVLDHIDFQDVTGASTQVASFTYTSVNGQETAGELSEADGGQHVYDYVYASDGGYFEVWRDSILVAHHDYAGLAASRASGQDSQVTFDWDALSSSYCGASVWGNTATYYDAGNGENSAGAGMLVRTFEMAEAEPAVLEPRLLSYEDSCGGSSNCSAGEVRHDWTCNYDDGLPAHPVATKDKRDDWTAYKYQATTNTGLSAYEALTEKVYEIHGATDMDGGGGLASTNYGYNYGPNGEQRVEFESTPSTFDGGFPTGTFTEYYDAGVPPLMNKVRATIRVGATETIDTSTGTPAQQERYLGTFYYDTHNGPSGSDHDPHGRTLEVHGPCWVDWSAGLNAEDCSSTLNSTFPITQYVYYDDALVDGGVDNNSGQLKTVKRWTGPNDTSGPGGTALITTYSDYDSYGHPRTVSDPNNVDTDYLYDSSGHVTQSTTNSLPTCYTYESDRLVAIKYPQGNSEVFCYRADAGAGCTGGTPSDKMQWKAKTAGYSGTGGFPTTQAERVDYSYWPDGTLAVEAYKDSQGIVRRVKKYSSDAQKRPTWEGWGGDPSAPGLPPAYQMARAFDGADNLSAVGLPYNSPDPFCSGGVNVQTGQPTGTNAKRCSWLYSDRADRLSSIDVYPTSTSSAQRTCIQYDGQSNISHVWFGCSATATPGDCTGCPTSKEATYQYDDFGNIVEATLPWMADSSTAATGTSLFEYDALGDVITKVVAGYKGNSQYFDFTYDSLGRPLVSTWHNSLGANTLHAFGYDSLPNTWDTNCDPTPPTYVYGHKSYQDDSFGRTYYSYDVWGRATREIRLRSTGGVPPTTCSSTPDPYANPTTEYTYTNNGDLKTIKYPYGRTVTYNYGLDGTADRASSVDVTTYAGYPDGGGATDQTTRIIEAAAWEPYGGLRGYQIDHPDVSNTHSAVEYMLGDDAGAAPSTCPTTAPQISGSDLSGRLRGIWVTQGNFSAGSPGPNKIYTRTYSWQADQVKQIDTCVLSSADQQEKYTYDQLERLKTASMNGWDAGGPYQNRAYGYDTRGNANGMSLDTTDFNIGYSSTHLDQMTTWGPGATGSSLQVNANRSYQYVSTNDGSVRWISEPSESDPQYVHGGYTVLTPDLTDPYPPDNLAYGVAQNCEWAGGPCNVYHYFYDAQRRRRLKDYPLGTQDEFFYDQNDQMLVDQGNADVDTPAYWVDDDYVWLGGRPVALIHGKLTTSGQRETDFLRDCNRNGQSQACDVYFPITDHIGKPVLMLNGSRYIAGVGEYDPYGNMNEVTVDAETEHNVALASGSTREFYTTRQHDVSGLYLDVRPHIMAFDALCDENGGLKGGVEFTTSGWLWKWSLCELYNYWFPFFPQNGAGHVYVYANPEQTPTFWGAVMDKYEYRRFQSAAKPFFTPLRFPGQYHDEETGLNQNWNRFYDPDTGRYTSGEPLYQESPPKIKAVLAQGGTMPAYSYAGNNPIGAADSDGNVWFSDPGCKYISNLADSTAVADKIKDDKIRKCVMNQLLAAKNSGILSCSSKFSFCSDSNHAGSTVGSPDSPSVVGWCNHPLPPPCQALALVHELAHACGDAACDTSKDSEPAGAPTHGELKSCIANHSSRRK